MSCLLVFFLPFKKIVIWHGGKKAHVDRMYWWGVELNSFFSSRRKNWGSPKDKRRYKMKVGKLLISSKNKSHTHMKARVFMYQLEVDDVVF